MDTFISYRILRRGGGDCGAVAARVSRALATAAAPGVAPVAWIVVPAAFAPSAMHEQVTASAAASCATRWRAFPGAGLPGAREIWFIVSILGIGRAAAAPASCLDAHPPGEVALADRKALHAQDVVGRRGVEVEVRPYRDGATRSSTRSGPRITRSAGSRRRTTSRGQRCSCARIARRSSAACCSRSTAPRRPDRVAAPCQRNGGPTARQCSSGTTAVRFAGSLRVNGAPSVGCSIHVSCRERETRRATRALTYAGSIGREPNYRGI